MSPLLERLAYKVPVPAIAYPSDEMVVSAAIAYIDEQRVRIAELEGALRQLVYYDAGKWWTGKHGDANVTDIVGRVIAGTQTENREWS